MSIDSDFDSDYYCAKSTTVEEDLDEECVPVQSDDNINQEDQVRHKLFYIEINEYIFFYIGKHVSYVCKFHNLSFIFISRQINLIATWEFLTVTLRA